MAAGRKWAGRHSPSSNRRLGEDGRRKMAVPSSSEGVGEDGSAGKRARSHFTWRTLPANLPLKLFWRARSRVSNETLPEGEGKGDAMAMAEIGKLYRAGFWQSWLEILILFLYF